MVFVYYFARRSGAGGVISILRKLLIFIARAINMNEQKVFIIGKCAILY